ncbi:MAG: hypothetical protein M0Z65_09165 [Firmicutes bacterium]|nr:hypothetical protein [Bacillota bacterium]
MIATALLAWTGGNPWAVALYMAGMAVLTFASVYLASETFQGDVMEEDSRAAMSKEGMTSHKRSSLSKRREALHS